MAIRTLRYREALREAMIEEMERDANVLILGEEVGHYDGAYKVTEGMLAKFGETGNCPACEARPMPPEHADFP